MDWGRCQDVIQKADTDGWSLFDHGILELLIALFCLFLFLLTSHSLAAPWISADWQGKEIFFPPGSLFWRTNEFKRCPVLYRTVLQVEKKSLAYAGFRARVPHFAYVFLNGRQIASYLHEGEGTIGTFDVEMAHLLDQGTDVLIISTTNDGFSLEGILAYQDGTKIRFDTEPNRWKAQKFPPLTILEHEPCMKPDFDDSEWFPVKVTEREALSVSDRELEEICQHLALQRLQRWDEDARWRLQMLAEKGIAIVDWEAYGWAGAERLKEWVRTIAREAQEKARGKPPGWLHSVAESLARYVRLNDEATNMENHEVALKVLSVPETEVAVFQKAANELRAVLKKMGSAIEEGQFGEALAASGKGEEVMAEVRRVRLINDLCQCLDNKFGWFDTNSFLDNDIANWGLRFGSPVTVFASPLSPAALVTLREKELILRGWDELKPLRVYNRPPITGPVCLWVVLNGKVLSLKPDADGVVYDHMVHGKLDENWALLVSDLSRGGGLPIQLVFLQVPTRIAFKPGEGSTSEVIVAFDRPGTHLFLLRPFKEWRGLLAQARAMTQVPLDEENAQRYIQQCRLWSRSLLNYPTTFSEVFVRDPDDKWALIVVDVYNYLEMQDEWGTKSLRLAPLPPLATYGLMTNYPGLKVIGQVEVLGSWGIWGDHIAAVDRNYIVYRVPLDPIKRFGGFTSFCFGPTDIGEPGNIKEIETIKRTGANSFRPQHNQTGERAMRTLRWCWEQGVQNVFNTDEKWIPDIVEHYRLLAEQCRDFPADAVAYDLLNEPETREPRAYSALIKKITNAIREVDKTHLIYVETMPPWGPGAQPFPQGAFETLEPTGDQLTVYSFHDYEFRLPSRWPNAKHDIRDILTRWIPAFRYSIDHRCPIHLGEFGGFEQTEENIYENPCAITLMMDYFRIFDQFGWHFHYYSNRGIVRVREDGSLQESYVQEAYRRYFARGRFNFNRR